MTTTRPTQTIPPEHHAVVRELIAWLRGEGLCPDHEDGFLATLPGWDDHVAEDLTPRMWAAVLEQALRQSTSALVVATTRDVADVDACAAALLELAAPMGTGYVSVSSRPDCVWVSVGDYRVFLSRTAPHRTVWVIRGLATCLADIDAQEAA